MGVQICGALSEPPVCGPDLVPKDMCVVVTLELTRSQQARNVRAGEKPHCTGTQGHIIICNHMGLIFLCCGRWGGCLKS